MTPETSLEVPVYEIAGATENDYAAILKLQEDNSSTHVPEDQKASMGFVTLRTDEQLLAEINQAIGITVARLKDVVVGYMMPMTMEQVMRVDLFDPFVKEFDRMQLAGATIADRVSRGQVCMGGQVCIDPSHRGKGIVQDMWAHLSEQVADYDFMISEINAANVLSLHVTSHILGFHSLGFYQTEGDDANGKPNATNWVVVGKDLRIDRILKYVATQNPRRLLRLSE